MTAHSNSGSGGSSFLGKLFSSLIEYTFKFLKWFLGEFVPKLLKFLWKQSSDLGNYFVSMIESSYGPMNTHKKDFWKFLFSLIIFLLIIVIFTLIMKGLSNK
jgi:hypothetical protein